MAVRHFRREGGGLPCGRIFVPPLFYTPPAPRRVLFRTGRVGVYQIWPHTTADESALEMS